MQSELQACNQILRVNNNSAGRTVLPKRGYCAVAALVTARGVLAGRAPWRLGRSTRGARGRRSCLLPSLASMGVLYIIHWAAMCFSHRFFSVIRQSFGLLQQTLA